MKFNESLFKKAFGFFSSKRRRIFALASFFVLMGIFVFVKPAFALEGLGGLVADIVGWFMMIWVWLMGQLIALAVYVLVAVASYNNFSGSEAVEKGWVIARDVANMFFVVIFLIIAFGTILGERLASNYHYKKALPRLLLMAILINFSKTIAGLLIDFSQVIMMTFVNGFSQIAGGNFLEILQINQLDAIRTMPGENATISGWDVAGAYLLSGMVATLSLVVITIMAMTLVMRMVMLWLLVVISPLVFFAYAVPSRQISGQWDTWWKHFVGELTIGPLLAFFIWLSLATVSSVGGEAETMANNPNIGGAEEVQIGGGTEASTEGSVGSLVSGMGDESTMIKYIIGLGMLIGGLVMAKQTSAMGASMAGGAVSWGRGMISSGLKTARGYAWKGATGKGGLKLGLKKAAGVPFAIPLAAGRKGGRWAGRKIFGRLERSTNPLLSEIGMRGGRRLREADAKREAEAEKRISHLRTPEQLAARRAALKNRPIQTEAGGAELHVLNKKLYGQGAWMKSTEENRGLLADIEKDFDDRKKLTGESMGKEMADLHTKRPDLMSNSEDMRKIVEDMTDSDLNKVGLEAFDPGSGGGQAFLGALYGKVDANGKRTAWEDILKSKFISGAKKEKMKKFEQTQEEYKDRHPEIIPEAGREAHVRGLGDRIADIDPKSVTKEIVGMMTSHQQNIVLRADKLSVDSIDADMLKADDGAFAAQIAQHGSDDLKESVQKKYGKEYLGALSNNMDKTGRDNPLGPGYRASASAASREMLRGGMGVGEAFNVDASGNFKGGKDETAFGVSVSDIMGGDSNLMLNLKPEEIKGGVEKMVQQVASNKDVLRKLVGSAKTDDQKDALEKIIRTVYKNSADEGNVDLVNFIEGTSRIRKNIPKEMMAGTRQRAQRVYEAKEEKRKREEHVGGVRREWQERKIKAKVVKAKRPIGVQRPGTVGEERERLEREAAEGGREYREEREREKKERERERKERERDERLEAAIKAGDLSLDRSLEFYKERLGRVNEEERKKLEKEIEKIEKEIEARRGK